MNVIFTHCTQSYPIKFTASNIKVEFVARGLIEQGATVTVINDSFGDKGLMEDLIGEQKSIQYYVFARKKRSVYVFLRNLWKGLTLLKKCKVKGKQNIVFLGGVLPVFLIQTIWAKMLGYKCVFLTQEWSMALNPKGRLNKMSAYASCYLYGYMMDGILPISHFLLDKNKHFNKPMHITPVLSEYQEADLDSLNCASTHFAYCAGAAYFRVIRMMMDAYKLFVDKGGSQNMVLVISGRDEDIDKAKQYVNGLGLGDRVAFKTQIPYEELMSIYRNALGLLIPLDPNSVQDQARFSQKIAEYVSTCRPIITCNVGEIPYYFKDKQDAVIAEYDVESFSDALMYLAHNVDKASEIGRGGYAVGKNCFDYQKNGKELFSFFEKL